MCLSLICVHKLLRSWGRWQVWEAAVCFSHDCKKWCVCVCVLMYGLCPEAGFKGRFQPITECVNSPTFVFHQCCHLYHHLVVKDNKNIGTHLFFSHCQVSSSLMSQNTLLPLAYNWSSICPKSCS